MQEKWEAREILKEKVQGPEEKPVMEEAPGHFEKESPMHRGAPRRMKIMLFSRENPFFIDFSNLKHEVGGATKLWGLPDRPRPSLRENPIQFLVNLVRYAYCGLVFFLARPFLGRQVSFNAAVMRAITYLSDQQEYISKQLQDLYDRLLRMDEDLNTILVANHKSIDQIEVEVKNIGGRLLRTLEKLDRMNGYLGAPLKELADFNFQRFEDRYRGKEAEIAARQEFAIHFFKDDAELVDLGCGRGEFLELLQAHGIRAIGVDKDPQMVEYCKAKGLEVVEADCFQYLRNQPDGSVGSVFVGMLVEHLYPYQIIDLCTLLYKKMKKGSHLVIETINPRSFEAVRNAFVLDPTHKTLVHNLTLEFILEEAGFSKVSTNFKSQVPPEPGVQTIELKDEFTPNQRRVLELIDQNCQRLEEAVFGCRDYYVIAER
ncbi:class I SAM-dependent methyltransferase [Candidatus Hakubella thermalkaliphila]|uniref:O-antigen chain-terminating methyltransferase n=1 Tax=Candidatus Hakubella thermalkaliphila TaxID=2754717 RepID=A0A6V8P3F7_9ACTN|nr:methyltransferase domain-containing protein [Candidatus Hakubella thermalkaliphila]GFP26887.1 O-antigen chain-terminating methyltransferase [Candidatus Hakubella thermalkaliphila]